MRTSVADSCSPVNRPLRAAIPALLLGALLTTGLHAAGVVTVNQPWVRPASARATTPAYLTVGTSDATTLAGARSPLGDVVLMQGKARVDEFALTPGTPLAMSARGPHLEIHGLARPLARGDRVPLTLVLREGSGATREIEVDAEVRLRSPLDDERREHAHGHAHAR